MQDRIGKSEEGTKKETFKVLYRSDGKTNGNNTKQVKVVGFKHKRKRKRIQTSLYNYI